MNIFKKLLFSFLLGLFFITSLNHNTVMAASVGEALNEPESGWTRHKYDSEYITYLGGKWAINTGVSTYASQWQKEGAILKFNFTGTKIRLISTTWWSFSKDIDVFIDGKFVEKISLYGSDDGTKRIKFEKLNLDNGNHSVEFINNTKEYLALYGIDTDGPLSPYQSVEPNPAPVDPTPTPDPTPSPNPNPSEPADPTEPAQPTGDRAILTVTMDTGLEKEFDLSMKEVNSFISWYEGKQSGSGTASYAIDKHSNNKGPFSNRKDYVIFNKILTFEVSEYSTK
ncbi:hypothetical protein [Paenibacillus kribbensis]|uniref:hypothetical protein n=1 Tax=Paenibacillus kribbensis TaxID=172713 RepID=UPI0008382DDC|nr:hypothetical protein [Paenibacillus kribbensis]